MAREKITSKVPFMGEGIKINAGLNQLGMRSIGEQLFNKLLPGLNNVSSRMTVGIDLAESFEDSVTKDKADKFLYIVQSGLVKQSELNEFSVVFDMRSFPENSIE